MILTSDYVYDNIKLNEARNIVQNTIGEFEKQYGFGLYRDVKVRCVGQFHEKTINETKIIIIDRYNIIGELNKIMQKSRGEIQLIKIFEVKIIIEGRISKNKMDMFFEIGCMPILWKKFYSREVNKKRYLYNKHINRNEKHYCHFNER